MICENAKTNKIVTYCAAYIVTSPSAPNMPNNGSRKAINKMGSTMEIKTTSVIVV